jgi:hypothetical protein
MNSLRARLTAASVVFVVFACAGQAIRGQTSGEPIRMTAWAVSMANVATGANAVIDIRIDKWSTEKERQELIGTFLDKGQDGLLARLQKLPIKGRMSIPGRQGPDPNQTRLGWNLRFAIRTPLEEGRTRILVATDRYMSFNEIVNQPRTVDYPFTFLDIRLNKDGEGEGKMAVATQLQFDKKQNSIIFENYSTEPVRLTNLKVEK